MIGNRFHVLVPAAGAVEDEDRIVAVALLPELARSLAEEHGDDAVLVFNCSGRGDKDMETIADHL